MPTLLWLQNIFWMCHCFDFYSVYLLRMELGSHVTFLCRSRSRKVADNICSQIHVPVEVSRDQSYARSSSYPTFSLP
jgi:hypothetical protein